MKELLLSILAASFAAAGVTALGQESDFAKYYRYICALLLVLCLLSPLVELKKGNFSLAFWNAVSLPETSAVPVPDFYLRELEEQVALSLEAQLERELGLSKDSFSLQVEAVDVKGQPTLSLVRVWLKRFSSVAKTGKIRSLVEEACGCAVEIQEDVRFD